MELGHTLIIKKLITTCNDSALELVKVLHINFAPILQDV